MKVLSHMQHTTAVNCVSKI